MAILNAVITVRRGKIEELEKSRLLPGEAAVASNGQIFWCYTAGKTKELASVEDLQSLLDSNPEAYTALQELIAELQGSGSLAENILNSISELQTNMANLEAKVVTGQDVEAVEGEEYHVGSLGYQGKVMYPKTKGSLVLNAEDQIVNFTPSSTYNTLVTGENLGTAIGKLAGNSELHETELSNLEGNVGELDSLNTTAKTSVVAAINEVNGKFSIADTASGIEFNVGDVRMFSGHPSIGFSNGRGTFRVTGFSSVTSVQINPRNQDFVVTGANASGSETTKTITVNVVNRDGSSISSTLGLNVLVVGKKA